MGLDTTHDCWHGAYSAFHRWRKEVAKAAGIPLELMEAYYSDDSIYPMSLKIMADGLQGESPIKGSLTIYSELLPIKWSSLKPDVLHVLLHHSDCDGDIPAEFCEPIADRLEELLPKLEGDFGGHIGDIKEKTQEFIDGLRLAASRNEPVEFH